MLSNLCREMTTLTTIISGNMGINLMVIEVEEYNSDVNDLGGRLTSEAII